MIHQIGQGKTNNLYVHALFHNENNHHIQQVTHEGELSGMRNNKQDIESAKKDTEVGIRFSKDFDFEEGDKVVCYRIFQSQPTLTWDLGF